MNEEPRFQPKAVFIDVLRKEKQKSEYDMRAGNQRLEQSLEAFETMVRRKTWT